MAGRAVSDTTSSVVRLSKRLARSAKAGFGKSIPMSRSTRRRNAKLLRRLRTTDKPSNRNTLTTRTTNTHTAILRPLHMEPMLDQVLTVRHTVRQLYKTWHGRLSRLHSRSLALTTLHTPQPHQVLPLLARPTVPRAEVPTLPLTLSLLGHLVTLTADRHSRHQHNPLSHKHRRSKAKHLRRRKVNHNPVRLLIPRQDSLISRPTIKLKDRRTVNRRLPDL